MAALSEKKTPTHPQKWSVGPKKWLADFSGLSHLSFTYSFFFFKLNSHMSCEW